MASPWLPTISGRAGGRRRPRGQGARARAARRAARRRRAGRGVGRRDHRRGGRSARPPCSTRWPDAPSTVASRWRSVGVRQRVSAVLAVAAGAARARRARTTRSRQRPWVDERRCSPQPRTGSSSRAPRARCSSPSTTCSGPTSPSLALGSFLVAAAGGLRIALAFGVRDEPAEMIPALRDAAGRAAGRRHPPPALRPRPGRDRASCSRSVLGYEPPPAMVEELHARTGGNPLFVKECARLLAARGASGQLPSFPTGCARSSPGGWPACRGGAYTVLAAAVGDRRLRPRPARGAHRHGQWPTSPPASTRRHEARLVVMDEDGYRLRARADPPDAARHATRRAAHRAAPARRRPCSRRASTDAAPDARAALAEQAAAHWARVAGRGPPAGGAARGRGGRGAQLAQLGYDHAARLYQWARDLGDDSLRDAHRARRGARSSPVSSPKAARRWPPAAARAAAERRGEALARAVLAARIRGRRLRGRRPRRAAGRAAARRAVAAR